MLRDVIEERRCEIADDQDDHEAENRHHATTRRLPVIKRAPLYRVVLLLGACLLAAGCAPSEPTVSHSELSQSVNLSAVRDAVMSWHIPQGVPVFRGARLLADAPRPASAAVALTKSIIRSNPRLSPLDALRLAIFSERSAHRYGLNQDFFGATILQESAFDPFAMSSAGALGIAQFMLETADTFAIDPLNPSDALDRKSVV